MPEQAESSDASRCRTLVEQPTPLEAEGPTDELDEGSESTVQQQRSKERDSVVRFATATSDDIEVVEIMPEYSDNTRVFSNPNQNPGSEFMSSPRNPGSCASDATFESWYTIAHARSEVDDPDLLRGAPVTAILRSCATILSAKPSVVDFYELSTQVEEIDTFVSHTWSTPRWKKFLVLIFHFNVQAALGIAFFSGALACCLTAQGLLPQATFAGSAQGVLCLPLGLTGFFTALFALHELDRCPMPWKRRTLFLDKACVHQTDLRLKRKGIQSIAAFLRHSRKILVIYADNYLQRLWTIYEVASWLILHQGEMMITRPVSAPIFVMSGCLCSLLVEVALFLGRALDLSSAFHLLPSITIALCMFPVYTFAALIMATWADERHRIKDKVAHFSLAEAQCSNEDDRFGVVQNIVALMKYAGQSCPSAEDEDVVKDFEELVRRDVPRMMWKSFGRVGVPFHWTVVLILPHALVSFDHAAGYALTMTPYESFLWWTYDFVVSILLGPIMLALIMTLTRRRLCRRICACVGIGLISTVLFFGIAYVLKTVTEKAVTSEFWILCLAPCYALLIVTTALLYRPLKLGHHCTVNTHSHTLSSFAAGNVLYSV